MLPNMNDFASRAGRIAVPVFLSALMNWLAQPNELLLGGSWVMGLVSLVPLYLLFRNQLMSREQARSAGLVYGLFYTLSSYFWLSNFGDYSLWTIGGVAIGYMLYHRAFFVLMWHLLSDRLPDLGSHREAYSHGNHPLRFAVAWTAFEFFKSRGYLAFPWNLSAFPFHNWLLPNQVADITGIWGLSFVVLLFQGQIGEFIFLRETRTARMPFPGIIKPGAVIQKLTTILPWGVAAVLIAGVFTLYGAVRLQQIEISPVLSYSHTSDSEPLSGFEDNSAAQLPREAQDDGQHSPLLVLLVQQNVDSWDLSNRNAGMENAIRLSRAGIDEALERFGRRPDFVSWSETSLSYPYEEYSRYFSNNPEGLSFRDYLLQSQTQLLTGAPLLRSWDPYVAMNGIIHLSPEGTLLADYAKIHLIPFAEHLPFTDFPFISDFLENVVGLPPGGWSPGEGIRLFTLQDSGLRIGTPVCFEDSFAFNTRFFVKEGADLLLNLTNNSWSKMRSAQMQHLVSARYRAIENRRPLLRSTNGGVTSIILPNGEIGAEISMFEEGWLLGRIEVQRNLPHSIYTLMGDWFAWLMTMVLVLMLLVHPHFRGRQPE